jgi:hypothetical protein
MDRYQIALRDSKLDHQVIFSFPPTQNTKKVLRYIHYCIEKRGVFSTEGIPTSVVDSALINISRNYRAPILVRTESDARALSIAHSYRNVFFMDKDTKLPDDSRPICYGSIPPEGILPLLVVQIR